MSNKPELTRKAFMKNTGVFMTPEYFDSMILSDYNESKQNDPLVFCKQWMKDHDGMTVETELTGKLRYIIDDTALTALDNSDVPEVEDLTGLDIIENICQDERALYDHCIQQEKNYDALKECWTELSSQFEKLKYQLLYLQDAANPQQKPRFIS
jgi:hypothetical protein